LTNVSYQGATREKVFYVFAAAMAELGNQAVMGFKPARKLAFRRKAGRTARKIEDLSHRSGVLFVFFFQHPLAKIVLIR
jgi:hypothetical protein